MEHHLLATCGDGMTDLLADEISAIGGTQLRKAYRVVHFTATERVYYAAHLRLRMAARILRVLKDIPAGTPNILFSKARQIRFDQLFAAEHPVSISVVSAAGADEDHGALPAHLIGSKLREAINDSFQYHQQVLPNQNSRDARVGVRGFSHQRRLMVSLDTSLEALHRRGVRLPGHPAPLKETLAAALLKVCGYDGSTPFYDPMCGSGTIALEAAQIATGTDPLLLRAKGGFGFEHLRDFNAPLWESLRAEARARRHPPAAKIYLSDIDPDFVDLARRIAACAGLEKVVSAEVKDFFRTKKPADRGLLIMNIPYGLRLGACRGIPTEQPRGEKMPEMRRFKGEYRESSTEKQRNGRLFAARDATEILPDRLPGDIEVGPDYLAALGDHLKAAFSGWRCGILVPASAPLKAVGLKPNLQAAFLNGLIPVKLLVYDIY